MGVKQLFKHRATYTLAALSLLILAASPAFIPAFASAAELQSRSIQLSSSAVSATNVTYNVTFTVSSAGAGAYVIDFCNNSPIPGTACTAPTGFSTSGVTTSTSSTTVSSRTGNSGVLVTQTVAGSATANVVLSGITNPSVATGGSTGFYARIVTYANATAAGSYSATDLTGSVDTGGVAMAINPAIGVNATVMETMTFCVSGSAISATCGSTTTPDLTLGVSTGNGTALAVDTLSTGNIYTQISTNAQSGAQVDLTSNATNCGGLLRAGATSACDIKPAPNGGFSAGTADFGVETSAATATPSYSYATGTYEPVSASGYNNSTYYMHYVAGNTAGVTSVYGDPFLDTAGAPVNNENMELTFGASISNSTPAGTYSADLGLIASGTF